MTTATTRRFRILGVLALCLGALFVMLPAGTASAQPVRDRPVRHQLVRAAPWSDCKDSPAPDMPGQGLAGFFEKAPEPIPAQEDPFAPGAKTTIYQQYGFAGLRWHNYDLGCGPDVTRSPEAVIGTAISNWMMNGPIALTALTSSLTHVAFNPGFLDVFDPVIARISNSLHHSLFATWVPAVIALLGIVIMIKARRSALATTAAAIGWALMVVLVATAIFRWPLAAGHLADDTVTSTLGSVVTGLDGHDAHGARLDPGVAVSSNVQKSIFYTSWLAGELGSTTSPTARKYGPALFKAQALTWHEASVVEHNPDRGKQLIDAKKQQWEHLASQIKKDDPAAYEYLTGRRSDTRVGYAFLASVAAYLALPFLLASALLLLGSFLIVRLAVMMFPAARGVVLGIGRTVGAAVVNAVIFGIGAAVTIRVLGLIFDPASKLPGWLSLVLMPLFGFIMWVALKPFRRLTSMVSPHHDHFGDAAGSMGHATRIGGRWAKRAATTAAAVYTGNVAAAATTDALDNHEDQVPERAEARPTPAEPATGAAPVLVSSPAPVALPAADSPIGGDAHAPGPDGPTRPPSRASAPSADEQGTTPRMSESESLPPTEPEWVDGEEVYTVYRPTEQGADDAA